MASSVQEDKRTSEGLNNSGSGVPNSRPTIATKLSDLRPYMKNLTCVFIVLEKLGPKAGEDPKISQCLVADASASILLSLWDTQGDSLQPGDIIRLSSGYCTLFKNALILCSGRYGVLERIGEFTMVFSETPNMSTLGWATDPQNPKILMPIRPSAPTPPTPESKRT